MHRGTVIPARNIALFLDVDGTLLEIAPTPDAVKVSAALRNTLQLAATRESGALALISGRSIAVLDRLFAPCVFPAAGLHGLERRDAFGRFTRPSVDVDVLGPARESLMKLQMRHSGLLLEDKGMTLALHYRLAPQCAPVVRHAMDEIAAALAPRFMVREGKFVRELMPAGFSKRAAIEAFMAEPPFAGRMPVFFGDDVTDEEGFAAVNTLGGCSVRVASREATVQHTQARASMSSVAAVVRWLRRRNLNFNSPRLISQGPT